MLDLFRTLPALMNELEDSGELRSAMVFAAWRRIAGPSLAEHGIPTRFENARLVVSVSNRTWQMHLKDLAGQMLFKINAALGSPVVSYIEFEVDEAFVRERAGTDRSEQDFGREAEKALTPNLLAAAEKIDDVELRKQFLLAAGKCLVRRDRARLATRL